MVSADPVCTVEIGIIPKMSTYSVLDVFGKTVSKITVPVVKAPEEMATPSARTRLTSSLNSPTEEVEIFSGLYPRPRCPRSERCLFQGFVIQFPENWIQMRTMGTNGSQISPFTINSFVLTQLVSLGLIPRMSQAELQTLKLGHYC